MNGLRDNAAEFYGMSVSVPAGTWNWCIEDGSGDTLDAVLCAVQAAWASRHRDHGVPAHVDALEGWIVDPELNGSAVCVEHAAGLVGAAPTFRE